MIDKRGYVYILTNKNNEVFEEVVNAITREKQIKGWLRNKKIELVKKFNPNWDDLYKIII